MVHVALVEDFQVLWLQRRQCGLDTLTHVHSGYLPKGGRGFRGAILRLAAARLNPTRRVVITEAVLQNRREPVISAPA
jgi:hypothetical protein